MSTIQFQTGSYKAELYLDKLSGTAPWRTRKLLKLMFSEPGRNAEPIGTLGLWLIENTSTSKMYWAAASQAYVDGYRLVSKKSRMRPIVEQRKKNRSLLAAVNRTKVTHDNIIRLQSILNEFILNGETKNV